MSYEITYSEMFEEAKDLLEPSEIGMNPEYERALCELIARCFPIDGMSTGEQAEEILERLQRKTYTDL
jgi:hypothetical protein